MTVDSELGQNLTSILEKTSDRAHEIDCEEEGVEGVIGAHNEDELKKFQALAKPFVYCHAKLAPEHWVKRWERKKTK